MADFRKWLYALAMAAVTVGLSVPANAQGGAILCTASTVPTLVRAQGYAELVGDYVLTCTGGTPTPASTSATTGIVPSVNIQVFLSTNITSKLTNGASSPFNEFEVNQHGYLLSRPGNRRQSKPNLSNN